MAVDNQDVLQELTGPNRIKAVGPDGIHPAIVQPLGDVIVGLIFELFKELLRLGTVPNDWNKATLMAIHNSGSRQVAENNRPLGNSFANVSSPAEVTSSEILSNTPVIPRRGHTYVELISEGFDRTYLQSSVKEHIELQTKTPCKAN
ncbi:unnamed protein product [Echinostoma caproni]|uniref:Reverse transcriptase domain-containing protein n=1 Tax=Echinostoma caproni TaxID=27848 RepID=A0A183A2C4_9TREM|nr:unnamed protein product [Echinostoma caproni]